MRTSGNAAGRVYRFFNLSCLVENFPSDAKVEESCTFDSDSCVNIAGKVATHSPSQSRSRTDKQGWNFPRRACKWPCHVFFNMGRPGIRWGWSQRKPGG